MALKASLKTGKSARPVIMDSLLHRSSGSFTHHIQRKLQRKPVRMHCNQTWEG